MKKDCFDKQITKLTHFATLGKLLSAVIHEINNPLAIISGCNDRFERKLKSTDELYSYLKKSIFMQRDGIERISKILEELGKHFKENATPYEQININQTLTDMAKFFQTLYGPKGLKIILTTNSSNPQINVNSAIINKLLVIYLTKWHEIFKETGKGTLLTITTDVVADMVIISFQFSDLLIAFNDEENELIKTFMTITDGEFKIKKDGAGNTTLTNFFPLS